MTVPLPKDPALIGPGEPTIAQAIAAADALSLAESGPVAGHRGQLELGAIAEAVGIHRIHILAWRDLADPEAGGSEVHAANIAAAWAAAGLDVTMRSSSAAGHPAYASRDGYRVIRKAGRYAVFPRTALSGLAGRTGPRDAMVEVWNGMPFFSPLWTRCPSVVFLHHVHAEMWRMVIKPRALARVGEIIEYRIAPPVYRGAQLVTLSESAKSEIVERLGLPAANIAVVNPGVGLQFTPSPAANARSDRPLIVAVGRLVPVKRFDLLVDALVKVHQRHPDLEAIIVGEGYERPALEAQIRAAGASGWLTLAGRISDEELVALYRRAWAVASASLREGWGMTLTEAAACGTPAVVTDIAGHRDAIITGVSGLLAQPGGPDDPTGVGAALDRFLSKPALRAHLSAGALEHAAQFTWEATARGTFLALAAEARRRHNRRRV